MKNIVFMGAPGSGKGTQSDGICEMFNIPHISTGDIFRATIKEGKGELADTVRKFVTSGDLVPDEIVIAMVMERVKQDDCKNGYLLDGFPRSMVQALEFDKQAADKPLTHVVMLDVNEDLLMKRLTGRRLAKNSGRIYNIYFNPPKVEGKCDESGEDLIHREDDYEDTVKNRLDVFKNQTLPLVEYYQKKGILHHIDGNKAIDEVFKDIKEVFSS